MYIFEKQQPPAYFRSNWAASVGTLIWVKWHINGVVVAFQLWCGGGADSSAIIHASAHFIVSQFSFGAFPDQMDHAVSITSVVIAL